MSAAKRRVALHSMLAAAAMTVLKVGGAGLMSGSLGVLSDGAHSGLDLIGSALTLFSVRVSDKPADDGHTYGHAKFETLSAFAEAGLMAISCAWIVYEAMHRILRHEAVVHHSLWPVLVLVTSVGVDWWRSRELGRVAKQFDSTALAADAFHFASDIWSTLAVLAGLGLSWLGGEFGITWLPLRRSGCGDSGVAFSNSAAKLETNPRDLGCAVGCYSQRSPAGRSCTKFGQLKACWLSSRHVFGALARRPCRPHSRAAAKLYV